MKGARNWPNDGKSLLADMAVHEHLMVDFGRLWLKFQCKLKMFSVKLWICFDLVEYFIFFDNFESSKSQENTYNKQIHFILLIIIKSEYRNSELFCMKTYRKLWFYAISAEIA